MLYKFYCLLLSTASVACATLQVVPGATWTATNTGAHVQAHGAGMFEQDGVYYMIGENKTSGSAFQSINCYSSTDLARWTFAGELLTESGTSGDLGPNRVVERPKVIYNAKTKKYILWMHIDNSNYTEAKVGVATGDSVCGRYTYLGSWQPLGYQSRDMSVFQDDDGSAYLLSEDRANGLRIDAMTDDYTNVTSATYLWANPGHIEAPAIWKSNGTYFMFGSYLSGWSPNDNVYSYATSLSGPWSNWTPFATVGSNTYNSQTNFILPLGDGAIYLGDRWESTNLMASTYIWLPLTVDGTSITMTNRASWVPNVATGTWAVAPSEISAEAVAQVLSNGAVIVSCSGCSNGESVGYLGGISDGAVTFPTVFSCPNTTTTIRIVFENGDPTQRHAKVTVNDVSQVLAFLPLSGGQTPAESTLHCELNQSDKNTITIQGIGSGAWAPDVNALVVPVY